MVTELTLPSPCIETISYPGYKFSLKSKTSFLFLSVMIPETLILCFLNPLESYKECYLLL